MRPGHSLAELLTTLAFLSVAFGAIGAAIFHGGRSTMTAGMAQEAYVVAAAALDSLTTGSQPTSGSANLGRYRAHWSVRGHPGGEYVEVTVGLPASGRALATLRGLGIPHPVPVLP